MTSNTNEPIDEVKYLAEKIKGIRIAMLSTTDEDGYIRSRPMGTQEADFDGTLWFFTKDPSPKVESIKKDQIVNVAYASKSKDLWISVAGRAQLVRDRAKMEELWTPVLKAWFPDGIDDPELALLRVEVDGAQVWESNGGKLVELFGMAKAAITGKQLDWKKDTKKIDLHH